MNGVINILKGTGMTSSDVVVVLRRILGERKVGHAGTLDPFAAGVLPVLVGKATRIFDYMAQDHKTYLALVCLGIGTDTLDGDGRVTARDDRIIPPEEFARALSGFLGEQMQQPPQYSAVSIDGQRMYDLARQGRHVELEPRPVTIYGLDIVDEREPNRFLVKVECSKGTYIRSLCGDIARRLGTCGHLGYLLRTASGAFTLDGAHTLEEVEACRREGRLSSLLRSPDEALSALPSLYVEESALRLLLSGQNLPASGPAGLLRIHDPEGLVGLAQRDEMGRIRMKTRLL